MATKVPNQNRFTASSPCPICAGYRELPEKEGVRCYGYAHEDGKMAFCTREEYAGALVARVNAVGACTYGHRLYGECHCGREHGPMDAAQAAKLRRRDPKAVTTIPIDPDAMDNMYRAMQVYLPDLSGSHWDYLERRGKSDRLAAIQWMYKLLPRTADEAETVIADMVDAADELGYTMKDLRLLPGVKADEDGVLTMHHGDGIVIPVHGYKMNIGGMVRMMTTTVRGNNGEWFTDKRQRGPKYLTFEGGGGDFCVIAGTPGPVLYLVEGIHKSYVVAAHSDLFVMGLPGAFLSSAHVEVIRKIAPAHVVEALDMDKLWNGQIAMQRMMIHERLEMESITTSTLMWDAKFKGLDDHLKWSGEMVPKRRSVHVPALRELATTLLSAAADAEQDPC